MEKKWTQTVDVIAMTSTFEAQRKPSLEVSVATKSTQNLLSGLQRR
jgi:hypothetical protein